MSSPLQDWPIHVGFGKCGSTFLQQYFRDHPNLEMIKRSKVQGLLLSNNDLAFDPGVAREIFKQYEVNRGDRTKRLVYFSERLVGNVLTGHYDMEAIARRLKQVFESPKIILMIRNQMSLIASIYRQHLKVGGAKTLERFIAPGDGRIPVFDWRAYQFHRVVELHASLFGRDNLLVIPLEQLIAKPDATLERVCAHCGVPFAPPQSTAARNAGFDDSRLEARRRLNTLFEPRMPNLRDNGGLSLRRGGALFRLAERVEGLPLFRNPRRNLKGEVEAIFIGRYVESNRRLQEFTGLDLGALGYELDGHS